MANENCKHCLCCFELIALIILPVTFNNYAKSGLGPENFFKLDEYCDIDEDIKYFCNEYHFPQAGAFFATTFLAMIANIGAVVCQFIFSIEQ